MYESSQRKAARKTIHVLRSVFLISPKRLAFFIRNFPVVNRMELTDLRYSNSTYGATCPVISRKLTTFLFYKASVTNNFYWIWHVFEWPIQSTAIHFPDHTHKSMICRLSRSYKRLLKCHDRIYTTFLRTNLHKPFCKQLPNCTGFNVNKSF